MDTMNLNQGQQQQQQPQSQIAHDANAPAMNQTQSVVSADGSAQAVAMRNAQAQMLPNQVQVPPHLMGLMTNPAMTAAGVANPLFPSANMLSNPAAFLAQQQPDAYRMQTQTGNGGGGIQHNIRGVPMNPSIVTNGFDASQSGSSIQQQQQGNNVTPIAPMGTMASFNQQNSAMAMPLAPASSNSVLSNRNEDASNSRRSDATANDRARQNRDRNREHARSTRLRKKAYVQKLKELVEGLHAERTEEVRQRRVAIQHLAEKQNVRRAVVRSFLRLHSNFETDDRKWKTILEENFWLKQPVTPYRSFRRAEIEQECRISRGVEAMVCDAASASVMIEGIGWRSSRWMQIKREEFLQLEEANRGSKKVPRCIARQESRLQLAASSLSSSSIGSSTGEDSNDKNKGVLRKHALTGAGELEKASADKKVGSSNGSSGGSSQERLHDYHAKPLPDPKLGDSDRSAAPSVEDSSANGDIKRATTDSSSSDDSARGPTKRRKIEGQVDGHPVAQVQSSLPPNIAKKGGIPHNVRPAAARSTVSNGISRLSNAPAVALPPFAGIGKRSVAPVPASLVGSQVEAPTGSSESPISIIPGTQEVTETPQATAPAVISTDAETSSSSSNTIPQIRGYYHINEDDMILTEDIIMCPFIFRSQDAVLRGALAECVMPGMLRAQFSSRNKLVSMEMVYDAMGFMQQLERASGNEGTAHIVPGSLEMALAPSKTEARVITLKDAPFLIVNVNDVWTRTTGYTQMEVEGKEYLGLLEGEGTVPEAYLQPSKPPHKMEDVADGRCACSTNIHYDKEGRDFVEFVCSYPLTNGNDEITHLLHVSKELPSLQESSMGNGEAMN